MSKLPDWDQFEARYIQGVTTHHARLREAGYSNEQIANMTARDVDQILDYLNEN